MAAPKVTTAKPFPGITLQQVCSICEKWSTIEKWNPNVRCQASILPADSKLRQIHDKSANRKGNQHPRHWNPQCNACTIDDAIVYFQTIVFGCLTGQAPSQG